MPEIAEVARIVHYLKKHAVGKVVKAVKTQEDEIIYGKVGTSASAFQKAMTGKKILDAKQQGKYFWLEMDSPPHPLMHFGMTGWMKFSNDHTAYYRPTKEEDNEWPPKFWKFILQLKDDSCEVAFVDPRRLGRIRLVDVKAEDMRKTTPLKENGPDPVIDEDILTVEWLKKKLRSKKVPIKALLLDQANISGIGNWVGDEILYHARLHPEQYSNTFSDEQIKQLHDSMLYVCKTAVETLGDSDAFPEDWLMKHRWDKGKKNGGKLPNGAKITFLKVGGRMSAIVPSVQKKTGAVAGDVSEDTNGVEESEDGVQPKRGRKRKGKVDKEDERVVTDDDAKTAPPATTKRARRKVEEADIKNEGNEDTADRKKPKSAGIGAKAMGGSPGEGLKESEVPGRRRSGRLRGA
ncbi:uncharacterized protein EI97DRAFT_412856 [Westerdykella ornata]|uniref:Formamidopyrimidine-DNA glycosylase catalytic domain-containing protein n=1 Tax=Westerdykella ornata TaxID=318751 RepID=A0A6A6JSR1_WESOR|nr:uncharacterized protein EI97DRAFT_412856 [Westerdykella ornata]KAF2279640.1 hypothetical protein EI97DRAFT_412856 [Westerdykella ornata]